MLMPNYLYAFALVVCAIPSVLSAKLPADIEKCKVGDDTCVAGKINEILQKYPNGNTDFGLVDLSNLYVPKINVVHNGDGKDAPVQINFEFTDALLTGLEKAKVQSVKGFVEDPKDVLIQVNVPELHLKMKYTVDGRILLLPIRGKGDGELILKNCDLTGKVKVKLESRNEKIYVKITKVDISLQPKGFTILLDNLFDGDKELSDSMLKTINENWQLLWDDLKPDINGVIGNILKDIVVPIFDSLPYDDFYAK